MLLGLLLMAAVAAADECLPFSYPQNPYSSPASYCETFKDLKDLGNGGRGDVVAGLYNNTVIDANGACAQTGWTWLASGCTYHAGVGQTECPCTSNGCGWACSCTMRDHEHLTWCWKDTKPCQPALQSGICALLG